MLYILFAAAAAALDQLFKRWIVNNIPLGGTRALIPRVVELTCVRNTGASFSMFSDMRWMLLGISAVCIVGLIVFLLRTKMESAVGKLAAAAVMGGAIGNAIDRAVQGYVVDMFRPLFIDFAVFNIADCFIVVGGILFCICYLAESSVREKDTLHTAVKRPRGKMPELSRLAKKRGSADGGEADEEN